MILIYSIYIDKGKGVQIQYRKKSRQRTYPLMKNVKYFMARNYLAIPDSTVPTESAFSVANNISKKDARPSHLSKLISLFRREGHVCIFLRPNSKLLG